MEKELSFTMMILAAIAIITLSAIFSYNYMDRLNKDQLINSCFKANGRPMFTSTMKFKGCDYQFKLK